MPVRNLLSRYTGCMPEDRTPAPLRVLLDFVNTRNVETDEDELANIDALRGWLSARGLMEEHEPAGDADLALAREIREELRAALIVNHGSDSAIPAEAPVPAGRAIASIPFTVSLDGTGTPALVPAQRGVSGALGRLLQPLPGAVADGSWARAKVCPAGDCLWAFYDLSRNRSRRWCSMEICGNREKSRSFRERHGDVS